MRVYEAAAVITSPAAVWAALADGAAWSSWDPGVERVEGAVGLGEKIATRSAPGRALGVKVTQFEPPGRLRLSRGTPLGLFPGVRTCEVSADANRSSTFRVREENTGPLKGLMWRSVPDLGLPFEQYANGLKRRVEIAA
jgi:hypothetical protein